VKPGKRQPRPGFTKKWGEQRRGNWERGTENPNKRKSEKRLGKNTRNKKTYPAKRNVTGVKTGGKGKKRFLGVQKAPGEGKLTQIDCYPTYDDKEASRGDTI